MKQYLATSLGLACIVLVIVMVVMYRTDSAQQQTDAATIAVFSNKLDTANTQVAMGIGATMLLSNNLVEAQTAATTFSNQFAEAQAAIMLYATQATNLTRQVADEKFQNENLQAAVAQYTADITNLTSQIASLSTQLATTQTNLDHANKNYTLLENRLRWDIAQRVVTERRFNNLRELKAQMRNLQDNPSEEISPQNIYAGLDVEVNSNGTLRVLSN